MLSNVGFNFIKSLSIRRLRPPNLHLNILPPFTFKNYKKFTLFNHTNTYNRLISSNRFFTSVTFPTNKEIEENFVNDDELEEDNAEASSELEDSKPSLIFSKKMLGRSLRGEWNTIKQEFVKADSTIVDSYTNAIYADAVLRTTGISALDELIQTTISKQFLDVHFANTVLKYIEEQHSDLKLFMKYWELFESSGVTFDEFSLLPRLKLVYQTHGFDELYNLFDNIYRNSPNMIRGEALKIILITSFEANKSHLCESMCAHYRNKFPSIKALTFRTDLYPCLAYAYASVGQYEMVYETSRRLSRFINFTDVVVLSTMGFAQYKLRTAIEYIRDAVTTSAFVRSTGFDVTLLYRILFTHALHSESVPSEDLQEIMDQLCTHVSRRFSVSDELKSIYYKMLENNKLNIFISFIPKCALKLPPDIPIDIEIGKSIVEHLLENNKRQELEDFLPILLDCFPKSDEKSLILLSVYSIWGYVTEAEQIFQSLEDSSGLTIENCTYMLATYVRLKEWKCAIDFFDDAFSAGLQPDTECYNLICYVYAQIGDVTAIETILEKMKLLDFSIYRNTATCLLQAFFQAKLFSRTIELFNNYFISHLNSTQNIQDSKSKTPTNFKKPTQNHTKEPSQQTTKLVSVQSPSQELYAPSSEELMYVTSSIILSQKDPKEFIKFIPLFMKTKITHLQHVVRFIAGIAIMDSKSLIPFLNHLLSFFTDEEFILDLDSFSSLEKILLSQFSKTSPQKIANLKRFESNQDPVFTLEQRNELYKVIKELLEK